jgi:hypothetical protein
MKIRSDDYDDWFVETYGGVSSIGTASTLGGDKPLPKGWSPPKREFNIGFHVAAPGPSHEEVDPEAKPARRLSGAAARSAAAKKAKQ